MGGACYNRCEGSFPYPENEEIILYHDRPHQQGVNQHHFLLLFHGVCFETMGVVGTPPHLKASEYTRCHLSIPKTKLELRTTTRKPTKLHGNHLDLRQTRRRKEKQIR